MSFLMQMERRPEREEEDTKNCNNTSLILIQEFVQKCVQSILFGTSVIYCIPILNKKMAETFQVQVQNAIQFLFGFVG